MIHYNDPPNEPNPMGDTEGDPAPPDRPRTAREIRIVFAMLASPHACPGCGDVTAASLCAACVEWGAALDYALVA